MRGRWEHLYRPVTPRNQAVYPPGLRWNSNGEGLPHISTSGLSMESGTGLMKATVEPVALRLKLEVVRCASKVAGVGKGEPP